jgi:hypothetical protein
VPPRGFVVLRIKADNPGAWLVHCHMEMHLVANMALVILVADSHGKIPLPNPPSDYPLCGSAGRYSAMQGAASEEDSSPLIGGFGLLGIGLAAGFILGLLAMFIASFILERNGSTHRRIDHPPSLVEMGTSVQRIENPVSALGEGAAADEPTV